MAINPELQKWLLDKITPALAGEEKAAFEAILAKEQVAQVFNEGLAGRSEINRRLDEVRTERETLNAQAQQYMGTLQNWQKNEKASYEQQLNAALTEASQREAALMSQLQQEGLQPAVTPSAARSAAQPPNGNGHKSFTEADVQRIVQGELSKAAMLPAVMNSIVEQHRGLFGNAPDMTKITDTAMRTNRSLHEVWRETYKVGDKETELQQAAIAKQIEDGVAERLAKMTADGAMAQQSFTGRPENPSPIRQMLQSGRVAADNSPLAVPQPVMQQSDGVNAAVEALRSGRYATKYPGQ